MRFLIRTFNHRAYPVGVALLLGGLSVRLATDGVTVQDVIVLAVLVLLAFAIWLALVSRQSAGTDSLQQFRKAVANGNKPTIVQFFSRYCVGCLATNG